jgi:hypothetical protein
MIPLTHDTLIGPFKESDKEILNKSFNNNAKKENSSLCYYSENHFFLWRRLIARLLKQKIPFKEMVVREFI